MPVFKYIAKDRKGQPVSGVLSVQNRDVLIENLRKRELIIISITEEKSSAKITPASKKIKADDLVIFARQLATMVDAGIPLVQALDILHEQSESKKFNEIIGEIANDVETGSSFSEALAKHPKVFSALFINMVKAGESSGTLDDILDRIAGYMEKSNALKRKIRSALVYPEVVTAMAIIITLVLLIKVIPVFKEIFAGFGAKLPTPTLLLITFSDFLRKYFILGVVAVAVAGFILSRYIATEGGRLRFDRTMLKLPVFGSMFRKVSVSKFARTLSTLIKSGVPILTSLEIVAKTSGNRVVELAVNDVRASIKEGENIAQPLGKSGVFPSMVVRMISVGEQTGEMEKMLTKIADFYDEQVDAAVSGLTSLIEPLIMAFLGIVIGSIVVAMFMPIFKLSQIISM
jgi:type IV pilus assembly protein PilC